MKYLLDTCVISEVIKPQADKNVISWMKSQDEDSLYLSVLTHLRSFYYQFPSISIS